MGESFYDAKPADWAETEDPAAEAKIDGTLTLGQIQKLLYFVQDRQEWAVRRMSTLIDEMGDAEEAWLAHESTQSVLIKHRLDQEGNKEKTSDKLRHSEMLKERNEEGVPGLKLYMAYRRSEDKVKNADRYCKMLEKRGSLLQTLNGNLKNIT